MPVRRYDLVHIYFTDGQHDYDWPILKTSLRVTLRILIARGYRPAFGYTNSENEPQRNNAVLERIHSHAESDAEKIKR